MPAATVQVNAHGAPGARPGTIKISVIGAAGGIGQSLSLLLKTNLSHYANVQLSLFDVNDKMLKGVCADLSHINNNVALTRETSLEDTLHDSQLVVIPAGVPRKPGMTRDDLFQINAGIVKGIASALNGNNTVPFVLLISNPVNSLLPVLQGVASPAYEGRCFGVTELDLVRASTFVNDFVDNATTDMPFVPVIGGHSGETILPVFSSTRFNGIDFSAYNLLDDDIKMQKLVHRVQYGGDEIVQAKDGMGSATLSMAYSAFLVSERFVSVLTGSQQECQGIFYTTLLKKDSCAIAPGAEKVMELTDNTSYFSMPCTVTKDGLSSIDPSLLLQLNNHELNTLLPTCINELKVNIHKGTEFASS